MSTGILGPCEGEIVVNTMARLCWNFARSGSRGVCKGALIAAFALAQLALKAVLPVLATVFLVATCVAQDVAPPVATVPGALRIQH
jgi:hypothetical protein